MNAHLSCFFFLSSLSPLPFFISISLLAFSCLSQNELSRAQCAVIACTARELDAAVTIADVLGFNDKYAGFTAISEAELDIAVHTAGFHYFETLRGDRAKEFELSGTLY